MKTKLLLSIGLSLSAGLVQAQSAAERPLRFVVGLGLTGGGETLATLQYMDGSSTKLKSGGLVHLLVGAEYRFRNGIALQGNVGYHVDDVTADNGKVTWSRVPVEFLGSYELAPSWRLGGGLRFATSAKVKGTGDFSFSESLKSSTGLVLEGEYLFSPRGGFKLRVVSEEYRSKDFPGSPKVDGTHFGGYFVGYF